MNIHLGMNKAARAQFFDPHCRSLPEACQDTVKKRCCSSVHQVVKSAPKFGDSIKHLWIPYYIGICMLSTVLGTA